MECIINYRNDWCFTYFIYSKFVDCAMVRGNNKFLPILVYHNVESRALNLITWVNSSNSIFNIKGDKIYQLTIYLFIIFQLSLY